MAYQSNTIQSPEDLKDYALRALGHPVINIEVTDEQIWDRINDTIQKFNDRHYAGAIERWGMITIGQDDLDRGYVTLPSSLTALIDISEPDGNGYSAEEFENFNFRLANSDFFTNIFGLGGTADILSYQMFHERIEMFGRFFNPTRRFRFNHLTHQLEAQGVWRPSTKVLIHGYWKADAEEHVDIYNEDFVKKYVIALVGRQWGANISKYDGVQLPGGITMNGNAIYDRYDKMVADIDDSFFSKYELPADFFIA